MSLYLVTDSELSGRCRIPDVVRAAVEGGVTVVQLREKHSATRDFVQLAREIKGLLHGVPLIINDRVDVALDVDADGVHLGQSDMPCDLARAFLGPSKIIGLSVENLSQIEEANEMDIDYIAVSPVFSTTTKTDTAPPFGLTGLAEAVRLSYHPVVAIGGINASNASQVISSGADGIAVVSAIVCAPDPRKAASELSELVAASKLSRLALESERPDHVAASKLSRLALESERPDHVAASKLSRFVTASECLKPVKG